MKQIKDFRTILFDMDGVLTSEQGYWNCAALTVYELLHSRRYFGKQELDVPKLAGQTSKLRDWYFFGDRTIVALKNLGVNSNWDLAYLVLAGFAGLDHAEGEAVFRHFEKVGLQPPELYDHAKELLQKRYPAMDCERNGELWKTLQEVFDEWEYGDQYYELAKGIKPRQSGKPGFIRQELPMHSVEETKRLLDTLRSWNITLGVGTGRPAFELWVPLRKWGLDQYFAPEHCVTHDDIAASSQRLGLFLAKPNPFTFWKAALGKAYPEEKIVAGAFDGMPPEDILVVGDAGADILAAKAMGAKFAAVLTGVNGLSARQYFEQQGADYIFNTVLELAG